jgi:hypothetical protein
MTTATLVMNVPVSLSLFIKSKTNTAIITSYADIKAVFLYVLNGQPLLILYASVIKKLVT